MKNNHTFAEKIKKNWWYSTIYTKIHNNNFKNATFVKQDTVNCTEYFKNFKTFLEKKKKKKSVVKSKILACIHIVTMSRKIDFPKNVFNDYNLQRIWNYQREKYIYWQNHRSLQKLKLKIKTCIKINRPQYNHGKLLKEKFNHQKSAKIHSPE